MGIELRLLLAGDPPHFLACDLGLVGRQRQDHQTQRRRADLLAAAMQRLPGLFPAAGCFDISVSMAIRSNGAPSALTRRKEFQPARTPYFIPGRLNLIPMRPRRAIALFIIVDAD